MSFISGSLQISVDVYHHTKFRHHHWNILRCHNKLLKLSEEFGGFHCIHFNFNTLNSNQTSTMTSHFSRISRLMFDFCLKMTFTTFVFVSLPLVADGFTNHYTFLNKKFLLHDSNLHIMSLSHNADSTSFDLNVDLTDSSYQQVLTADLLQLSGELRKAYDSLFDDPREPNGKRFSFDPWFVRCGDHLKMADEKDTSGDDNTCSSIPGEAVATERQIQYSLKRAQLSQLLDDSKYDDMVDAISRLGQSIGCSCITPPWLSIYLQGDMQNFHTDAPHGPMAYVLSLSLDEHYNSSFKGGETILMQPQILDYWRNYDESVGLEIPSIMRFLPPKFGRIIAFDPRIPHGVAQVDGTNDPRNCRIVVHGWFAEPETTFFGDFEDDPEAKSEVLAILNQSLEPLIEALGTGEIGRVVGFLSVKVDFDEKSGSVSQVSAVCDTLIADPEDFRGVVGQDMEGRDVFEDPVSDVKLTIEENLGSVQIREGLSGSIVVPFVFT